MEGALSWTGVIFVEEGDSLRRRNSALYLVDVDHGVVGIEPEHGRRRRDSIGLSGVEVGEWPVVIPGHRALGVDVRLLVEPSRRLIQTPRPNRQRGCTARFGCRRPAGCSRSGSTGSGQSRAVHGARPRRSGGDWRCVGSSAHAPARWLLQPIPTQPAPPGPEMRAACSDRISWRRWSPRRQRAMHR